MSVKSTGSKRPGSLFDLGLRLVSISLALALAGVGAQALGGAESALAAERSGASSSQFNSSQAECGIYASGVRTLVVFPVHIKGFVGSKTVVRATPYVYWSTDGTNWTFWTSMGTKQAESALNQQVDVGGWWMNLTRGSYAIAVRYWVEWGYYLNGTWVQQQQLWPVEEDSYTTRVYDRANVPGWYTTGICVSSP